jgi:hypothetical protein
LNFERIYEPIVNPPKTPKASTQNTQCEGDGDVNMADGDEEEDDTLFISSEEEEEEVSIDLESTSTRPNLPSTVTIKRQRKSRSKTARKPRDETTWTQAYFNVTTMDETWVNKAKEGYPTLANRLWTCRLCGPHLRSTDAQRHGNTTA